MRSRRIKLVSVNGGSDFLVTGWKADEVIQGAGTGPVWSRLLGGWLLYARDVADLLAYAQVRGIEVRGITVEAARELRNSWTESVSSTSPRLEPDQDDAPGDQLALFDGSR